VGEVRGDKNHEPGLQNRRVSGGCPRWKEGEGGGSLTEGLDCVKACVLRTKDATSGSVARSGFLEAQDNSRLGGKTLGWVSEVQTYLGHITGTWKKY
jgi:hypothetical protein